MCNILLVEDDWDYDTRGGTPYYTSTLEAAGYPFSHWDTETMGTPTAGDMAPYEVVVWFTGYDWQTPISPTEELELIAYLDNGGNLLMSSQEQHYAFGLTPLMTDYFWVDSVVDDVVITDTVGNPTDTLFAGLGPYTLARPDQWDVYWPTDPYEGPYDDEVHVKAGGYEPFIYDSSGMPNSTRYEGSTFKTLYLGWPFEWLPSLDDRVDVMSTALTDWFGCAPPCIELTGADVSGPPALQRGETGIYTVTLEPPNATPPLDVLWDNGSTDVTAAYSWTVPGVYTIVVTATNCYGTGVVTATFDVEVLCDELTGATIGGPVQLLPSEAGVYMVTLDPPTATLPIEILWSNGSTGMTTTYSWSDPGIYTVAVTATNCAGTAVVTDTFEVEVLCVPVDEAAISGPTTLLPGEMGTYTTTWGPPTATLPVEVLWSNGMTSTTAAYSWSDPGFYVVEVTTTNCAGVGMVTATLPVEVVCDELVSATLFGPTALQPVEEGTYTVTLEPPTATLPIDILWSNGMTGTTAVYSWTDPGAYTIVVTATNCGTAVVTGTLDVTVGQPGFYVYLPLVAKNN